MTRNTPTRWAALFVSAAMTHTSQAALTALNYRLGEDDAGAANGSALQATTDSSRQRGGDSRGFRHLARVGRMRAGAPPSPLIR
jgi:hypothetical protein